MSKIDNVHLKIIYTTIVGFNLLVIAHFPKRNAIYKKYFSNPIVEVQNTFTVGSTELKVPKLSS